MNLGAMLNAHRNHSLFFVASVILTTIIGCGGGSGLSEVKGTVTLDGKAYPNAQVRFVPEGGRPSIGITDDAGQYRLHYMREEFGAAPGSYKVDITTNYTSTSDSEGGKAPAEKIPAKYNTRTELVKEVTAGENKIDFDLKTK